MSIARFSIDGNVAFGAVEGDKPDELVLDIIKGIPFADFELSGTKVPLSKVRLLPPVLPNKVVAFGRNYAEHALELGNEVPDAPFAFFNKGCAARVSSKAVVRFVEMTRSYSSAAYSTAGLRTFVPTLLTSTSSRSSGPR